MLSIFSPQCLILLYILILRTNYFVNWTNFLANWFLLQWDAQHLSKAGNLLHLCHLAALCRLLSKLINTDESWYKVKRKTASQASLAEILFVLEYCTLLFLRLSLFFFHLLSVVYVVVSQKTHPKFVPPTKQSKTKSKNIMLDTERHILLLGRCHRTLFCSLRGHLQRTECVVLFSKEKTVLCRSLLWDDRVILITDRGWQKRQNIPPIRLGGGGGSALVKLTGTALSKVFQDSAKGSLPKTTDVQGS